MNERSDILQIIFNNGYDLATIVLNPTLDTKLLKKYTDYVMKITYNIRKYVIGITFKQNSIIVIMDEGFPLGAIRNFDDATRWNKCYLHNILLKGYLSKEKNLPDIFIMVPVVWAHSVYDN